MDFEGFKDLIIQQQRVLNLILIYIKLRFTSYSVYSSSVKKKIEIPFVEYLIVKFIYHHGSLKKYMCSWSMQKMHSFELYCQGSSLVSLCVYVVYIYVCFRECIVGALLSLGRCYHPVLPSKIITAELLRFSWLSSAFIG